jgi:gamma-glutamylcyclotransferase (GGCT)/AIG2-like uncharacterized protein YtfP
MASGFLFFAYGEMAAEAYMTQVDALADLMGNAKASDHRFGFTAAGHANIKPEPGAHTWGTLWMIPARAMEQLDALAASKGLQRGVVFVVSPAGPRVPATVYARADAPAGQPSAETLAAAQTAAETMKLDRRFRKELRGWKV